MKNPKSSRKPSGRNPKHISKKILSDPVNKWVFSVLKSDVFLVGGYVRDILRGVVSRDKDYAVKNAPEDIAKQAAKKFNGTCIPLKEESTYRVVLKNKNILDFSSFQGITIEEDLLRRDFTINAIAWSPETGILDPFTGRSDLKNKIVKAVRVNNFLADPLRVVRAYRIAAELGFGIEQNTRVNLKRFAKGLVTISPERITEEMFKILKNKNAAAYLNECCNDGVLEKIFKKKDGLESGLRLLNKFDFFLKNIPKKISVSLGLEKEISQGLTKKGLIRLALLLIDKEGHALKKCRLRVSRNIHNAVENIHAGYSIAASEKIFQEIPRERLFKIFKTADEQVYEMSIILAVALGLNAEEIFKRAQEYLRVKNKTLLNGDDIQRFLNIPPGYRIGRILSALQEAQFKGYIKTKAEARRWITSNFT
ncbi:MAG: CCA tRNA nucleotidyltransferase [Nitrospirae bacterium]|nr:CCA tRNA nucleotidyltransferase [Nitrospirota bacterium]